MKKFLVNGLIIVAVCSLLTLLLHKQLITTVVWYLAKHETANHHSVLTVPTSQTTAISTVETSDLTHKQFQSVSLPLIFSDSVVKLESSSTLAITNQAGDKVYTLFAGTRYADVFVTDKQYTSVEKEAVCHTVSDWEHNQLDVCDNNFLFLTKMLHTSPDDIGFLSSRANKTSAALLLIQKTTYLDANVTTIVPVTIGERLKGYRVSGQGIASLFLFDDNDNPYLLTFHNLSETEIETLLTNLAMAQ